MINVLSKKGLMVHLHVHGEFSKLDGFNKSIELVAEAKRLGQTALALTDHGVMGGIPGFIQACKAEGIKPIPGVEAYMTKNRFFKTDEFSEMKARICEKYKIGTKPKTGAFKPKLKAFNTFVSAVSRDWSKFDDLAKELIKDWLMEEAPAEEQFNLFAVDGIEEDRSTKEFEKEILEYLEYDSYHLLLIAINDQGLRDLYRIVSDSHINGFYSDPRTDFAFIKEHGLGKNIIATSTCLGGYFAKLINRGQIKKAKEFIQECKDTFHSFYLEKQATTIPMQLVLNDWIDKLAIETNTPKIVTTDAHFANADSWESHDVLVASSFGKCVGDTDRYIYSNDHYLKSEEEVLALVNDPEAIANTFKIAEMVDVNLPKEPLLPKFKVEGHETPDELLKNKAWTGLLHYLFENPHLDAEKYSRTLDFELSVIINEGFSDYFMIVSDYCQWAKDHNRMRGPGRGSAAGSLVAMCINITAVDPIKYDLMFERFLSPDRISYPDIDADFPYETCIDIIKYMQGKYGHEHVAQIGTYGTLAAKSILKLMGKTLGYDLSLQNEFAKAIPTDPEMTLEKAHKGSKRVQELAVKYPKWWKIATELEGHVRSESTHAGGVVLSPKPLYESLPVRIGSDDIPTTQYDMQWVEKFLVKFDILKLNTLELIDEALSLAGIKDEIDLTKLDLDDPFVYETIYKTGLTDGVFQVESAGMRDTLQEMGADCFNDIIATCALYRPGPMDYIPSYIRRKKGLEPITYPFDVLEPILKETYGIFVYQEQVMLASVALGGLSKGQSDYIRKGVAKKDVKILDEWVGDMIYGNPEKNIEGAINRGHDEKALLKLKEEWTKFGDYAFNKSHSVAYAMISFWTAWLKAYYPEEFIAALLSVTAGKKDKDGDNKQIEYMNEAEKMGIKVLQPGINTSNKGWTTQSGTKQIRYGLSSIAKVTDSDYEVIEKYRPFENFNDFLAKNEEMKIKKDKVEMLIKSGVFDGFSINRNKLLRDYYRSRGDDYDHIPETTGKRTIMEYEREAFGTTISIKSRWEKIEDGKEDVTLTGSITMFEEWTASSGKTHGRGIIATAEEPIDFMIWGFKLGRDDNKEKITVGNKVSLKGNKSGDKLIVNGVQFKAGVMHGEFYAEAN